MGGARPKKEYTFIDSLKAIKENLEKPKWDDVVKGYSDVLKLTALAGFTTLIFYVIYEVV